MSDKITINELPLLATPSENTFVPVTDTEDTSESIAGTTKKVRFSDFLSTFDDLIDVTVSATDPGTEDGTFWVDIS